jgi:hypothetical protein
MKAITTFIANHRNLTAGAILSAAFCIYATSCESTCRSISDPARKLTRTELQTEIDIYLAAANGRIKELDHKDSVKVALFEQLNQANLLTSPTPGGIISMVATIAGVGAILDQRRNKNYANGKKDGNNPAPLTPT